MVLIYTALLSKALYSVDMTFTHSFIHSCTHSHTDGGVDHDTGRRPSWSGAVRVRRRRLAQGTPRHSARRRRRRRRRRRSWGSNQQPTNNQLLLKEMPVQGLNDNNTYRPDLKSQTNSSKHLWTVCCKWRPQRGSFTPLPRVTTAGVEGGPPDHGRGVDFTAIALSAAGWFTWEILYRYDESHNVLRNINHRGTLTHCMCVL